MTNEEQGRENPVGRIRDQQQREIGEIIEKLRKNFPVEPIPMIALLNFMVMELIQRGVRAEDFMSDVSRCWMYHEIEMKETESREMLNENA